MQAMSGAPSEAVADMAGGADKLLHGDIYGGLQGLVPRSIRDVMKAENLASQGVLDGRGKTILPASQIGAGDVAAQALGFQPSRVTEFREGRAAIEEAREEARADRAELVGAWVKAQPVDRAAVMSQIRVWNMAHPGQTITVDQLMREAQTARRAAAGGDARAFGLKLPAKAAAALERAGAFANVR